MSEPDSLDEDFLLHTDYSRDNFKFLTNTKNDSPQRIAVFEHKNRRFVRVFEAATKEHYYRCVECHSKHHQEVKAKLSTDGRIFKVYEEYSHQCSPSRYLDVVMIGNASSSVIAAVDEQSQDEPMPSSSAVSSSAEEEEIDVSLPQKQKKTKKKKIMKKKPKELDDKWKELDSTKFEFGCSSRRVQKTRLIIFESDNPQKVRIYGIDCNKKHYKCLKCNVAKAFVKGDNVIVQQDHSCPFNSYAKAKAEQEKITQLRIAHPGEYEFGMNKFREAKKRLIIFEPNDRSLARDYSYNPQNRAYVCLKCQPKHVSAKLLKDSNGNEYAEISNAHKCKPRPYKKIKEEQDSFKDACAKYEIFKGSKFKFHYNARGAENGRLIIFPSKNRGYEYFRQTKFTYLCMGCERNPHNVRVAARVIKDKNGKECISANMSHVCQMVDYRDVLNEQKRIKERCKLI